MTLEEKRKLIGSYCSEQPSDECDNCILNPVCDSTIRFIGGFTEVECDSAIRILERHRVPQVESNVGHGVTIYDKLVRDKIPEIIRQSGKEPVTRILDDDEYKFYLKKKLQEEVDEFVESESLEELADVYEVILSLCNAFYYNPVNMMLLAGDKNRERGDFSDKILLIEVKEKEK